MPEAPSCGLPEAFAIAVRSGLRLIDPDERRPWSRLVCTVCGAALDVPSRMDERDDAIMMFRARRVTLFARRHLPGQVHR
ncbi:MAG: hypothetical protein JXA67_13285 [Micromonosporaceae bacterium]|nr:hypothetical protein [Micromonosporaceae bacterium]